MRGADGIVSVMLVSDRLCFQRNFMRSPCPRNSLMSKHDLEPRYPRLASFFGSLYQYGFAYFDRNSMKARHTSGHMTRKKSRQKQPNQDCSSSDLAQGILFVCCSVNHEVKRDPRYRQITYLIEASATSEDCLRIVWMVIVFGTVR